MVINENTPKKICILSNGLVRGGTDTFVVNLAKGLDKTKYDITVVLPVTGNENCLRVPELLEIGVTVKKTCSLTGFRGRAVHLFRLFRILREEKYDVFQTNIDLFNGVNIFVSWLAGTKIRVCHSHNSQQQKEAAFGRTPAIAVYQGVMRWLCWTFSNRRAGCSKAALDFLFKDKWKKDPRAIVVNNGIDIARFRSEADTGEVLQEIGAKARYHILTVGRISPQKNPMLIADIFAALCKKREDCDLIWVGIGEMEAEVKAKLRDHGVMDRVLFLGTRGDVNELMQCSDVFLFPSLFEGLGIVVIEAQAAGLPCVISDTIPGMVDCGGCCFLPLSDAPELWAQKVCDVLDGKETFCVDEERLNQYSIEHMVEQMESLFEP